MEKKTGRNDPCPCGSGKKFKSCCLEKIEAKKHHKHKLTAKWLNPPQVPNLMERTFGQAITSAAKTFIPISNQPNSPTKSESSDGG